MTKIGPLVSQHFEVCLCNQVEQKKQVHGSIWQAVLRSPAQAKRKHLELVCRSRPSAELGGSSRRCILDGYRSGLSTMEYSSGFLHCEDVSDMHEEQMPDSSVEAIHNRSRLVAVLCLDFLVPTCMRELYTLDFQNAWP